jgi:hypothetical protein
MKTLFLALFGLCLFVPQSEAKQFRLVVVGARLSPLKASGQCWDWCRGGSQRKLRHLQKAVKRYARMGAKKLRRMALKKGMTKVAQLATGMADPTGISLVLALANGGFKQYAKGTKMPDAFVTIKLSTGQVIKTHRVKNTIVPQWGTTETVQLDSQTHIQFYVWDKDLREDDPIGRKVVTSVPKRLLAKGGTWRLHFGGVYELELLLIPVLKTSSNFQPGYYNVTVLSATVARRKRNGRPWDAFRGRPDPVASIQIGRYRIRTSVEKNSFSPSWNKTVRMYLTGNEDLRYLIYDKDFSRSDRIGSCLVRPIKKLRFERNMIFRARCQQIREINIRFSKIR